MKTTISPNSILHYYINRILILGLFLITVSMNAQIGIGTIDPDPSSILDIKSDKQGLLVPRMSSYDRGRIDAPADGLLVYDTDLKAFYHYDLLTTSWLEIISTNVKRDNYVLVKSPSDFPAPVSGKITLEENYLYEINGSVSITNSIDLNNATIAGRDAFEDVIQFTGGTIFDGSGGTIRNVTLKGGTAFNISGPGLGTNSSLIIQNVIIDGMTSSVGKISNIGLYFGNIIQYLNNTNGITYENIGNLLLSNQGWFANNYGTYETLTGGFGLVEKISGFSTVNGAAVAMNFNSNPTVGNGVILNVVFSGTSTDYIKGYTPAPYAGYNFTNQWTVDCPGIPKESDGEATGDINLTATVGSGAATTFTSNGTLGRTKLAGTTSSSDLLRFEQSGDNKIIYRGLKKRFFQVTASISYQSNGSSTHILYVAKGGNVVADSKVYGRAPSGFFIGGGILALPIVATVELSPGDSIEVFAERMDGAGNLQTVALNLTVR